MLKFLYPIPFLSAIAILAETAFNLPVAAQHSAILTPNNSDELVCYMKTSGGETMNLTHLCNSRRAPQGQVVIQDAFQDGEYVLGSIVNQTGKIVRNVQVNYEVRNESNSVIEKNSVPIAPSTLNPGQTATFEALATAKGEIRATSVSWSE